MNNARSVLSLIQSDIDSDFELAKTLIEGAYKNRLVDCIIELNKIFIEKTIHSDCQIHLSPHFKEIEDLINDLNNQNLIVRKSETL